MLLLRERPKFMGYPGRVYRQGGGDFFSAEKKGAKRFFQQKKGGAEFFSAKKKGVTRFFQRKKKGGDEFFSAKKRG